MKKTKSMTPKQVQKKLNALCQGLGDAWMRNYANYNNVEWSKRLLFINLGDSILWGFKWSNTKEGNGFWSQIFYTFNEMEYTGLI